MASPINTDDTSLKSLEGEFLRLVCLNYWEEDSPKFRIEAKRLLVETPEITGASIYAASATGDTDTAEQFLNAEPGLLNQKGGIRHWEPLMYAAYSRLPGVSTFPVGKLLIERGADPNAHHVTTYGGDDFTFSALTGVFGGGGRGPQKCPMHREAEKFCRLLLEAGAAPNDLQAAYNQMFSEGSFCLELLLEYGLAEKDIDQEIMHYQLMWAVGKGHLERVKLLVEAHVDINKKGANIGKGKTAYEFAVFNLQSEIADYLMSKIKS